MNRLLNASMVFSVLALTACGGGDEMDHEEMDMEQEEVAAAPMPEATTPAPMTADGLLNANEATEQELTAAGVPAEAASMIVAGQPYDDALALNAALEGSMDEMQREELYRTVWVPLDLNTASEEEILLIPGVGDRMAHEFEEYRPYRGMEQFRREIGKYVDEDEVARLEQYVMIAD